MIKNLNCNILFGILVWSNVVLASSSRIDLSTVTYSKSFYLNIINDISKIYQPIIKKENAELAISFYWDIDAAHASSLRQKDSMNKYEVHIYGGLAKHTQVSKDAFAFFVCHELGHHIGGAPKMLSVNTSWASAEGQADHWAASVCLKDYFKLRADSIDTVKSMPLDQTAKIICKKEYGVDKHDQAICLRVIMAGLSVTNFLKETEGGSASLDRKSSVSVDKTILSYPELQCRLDTIVEGALRAPKRSSCWFNEFMPVK